ncbi:MAG: hypothetical protein ACKVT0_20865 [Planctomycetaceae bacterium]
MQMGGIGGIGGSGMSMGGISFGGASAINVNIGAPAAGGSPIDQAGMSAGMSPQMNQLVELMQGFNTAEILMALMLASGGKSDDDDKKSSSNAAMGFLAGLAVSSQMNQMPMSIQFSFDNAGTGIDSGANGMCGMSGGGFNVLA